MAFIHISVFIVAIAFALVSVFFAKLLLRVSGIIGTVGKTVSTFETKLDKTVIELERTIAETNATATDIEEKSLALNSVFYTVKHVGDSTSLLSEELAVRTERYAQDSIAARDETVRARHPVFRIRFRSINFLAAWKACWIKIK